MLAAPRSLFAQLVLTQIAYGLVLALGFLAVLELTHTQYHLEATQRQSRGWAGEILNRYRAQLDSAFTHPDASSLERLIVGLGYASPATDFYVADQNGKIQVSSVPSTSIIRHSMEVTAIKSLIENPEVLPVMIDDPVNPKVPRVFSVAAIEEQGKTIGYLVLVLRDQDAGTFHFGRGSYVFRESAVMIAGLSVLAFCAAVLILLIILKPIRKLSRTMELFRRESGITWPSENGREFEPEGAELERLGQHFNDMARQIVELLHRLKDDDRRMREMFANISHDLRTPLTIIQGCLETMQDKGDLLKNGQRHQLAASAAAQARYLGRLIEAVFELAKLQSPNYQLHLEPLSIAEAVQDIAMKFSVKATRQGVEIRIIGGEKHIHILADVLLVERALDNLIDNALRHAKGANEIAIHLVERASDVEITISDNGNGLPKSVIDRMTEEMQGEPSYPGTSENGLGLGLNIVRRILELHGSHLELVKDRVKGTAFRFFLRKVDTFDLMTEHQVRA